jgi:hypothetical protein
MRMRMLGVGHTLQFWASAEVNSEISALSPEPVSGTLGNREVLKWAENNSQTAIRDGFLHWVNAGLNYTKKNAAHSQFIKSGKNNEDHARFGNRCADGESTQLMSMYGVFRSEEFFHKIAEDRLEGEIERLKLSPEEEVGREGISEGMREDGARIIERCRLKIPDFKKLSSLLDEEQERELEHEDEDEQQAPRPGGAEAAVPIPYKELGEFVKGTGSFDALKAACLIPLHQVFRQTHLWPITQPDAWGSEIWATLNFAKVVVIRNEKDTADNFLRPPSWIMSASPQEQGGNQVSIFLSPNEVNELMPVFRSRISSEKSGVRLHTLVPRVSPGQSTLLNCLELCVPSSVGESNYFTNWHPLNSTLLLFSGSQYFADKEEQDAYAQFTGFIPHPRTKAEQDAFDNGWTANAFVLPQYRGSLSPTLEANCKFTESPDQLVQGIISRRNEFYSSKCHVIRLVSESSKEFQ